MSRYFEFQNPQSKIRNRGPLTFLLGPLSFVLEPFTFILYPLAFYFVQHWSKTGKLKQLPLFLKNIKLSPSDFYYDLI